VRLLRACLLLSLLPSGCTEDPTVPEDPYLGSWQLVSINDQPLPYPWVSIRSNGDSRYELISSRFILEPGAWSEERNGRTIVSGVVTPLADAAGGTWERAGDEILLYNARGYAEGAASTVGGALSVIRYSLLDRGKYFLYRK
jgi:hypothetical protein